MICVFSGRTQDSGAVSTCNYIARNLGVRSGMPIVLAKRILRDDPSAVFLAMDLEYYQAVSERIMEMIRPSGQKFEQASIDEAYIDVTQNVGPDFDVAEKIGERIKAEILSNEKMTCSIGIAQNKLMAKIAVDAHKPDGFTVIHPGLEKSFLNPMPVGKLFGVGPKTEEKLESLGVHTIADLASMDQDVLSKSFGKNLGPALLKMANGIDESPVAERKVEQMSRIVTLKNDAEDFEFADVLGPISLDLSRKLADSKLICRTVGVIAITNELKIKTRSKTSGSPIQSKDEILKAASGLFVEMFTTQKDAQQPFRIRRVGIKISDFENSQNRSETLEGFV